jgi:glycosyltransferase involved in cell wall biosynthesis
MAPKICQVGLDLVPLRGGTPRAVFDIQQALGGSIVSFTDPAIPWDTPGATVTHAPWAGGWLGRQYAYVTRRDLGPAEAALAAADVVLVHGLYRYHFDWAARRCRNLGKPLVIVPHGGLDPYVFTYRALQKKLWLAWQRSAFAQASLVLFVTARERDKALQLVTPRATAVAALPLELGEDAEPARRRDAARRRRGYAPADRVLLLLGRLDPVKRPLETIRAFARAHPRAPALQLLVVGPDERVTRAQCEALARALKASRVRVEPAAYGSDKQDVLACADVLVNFSGKENFGYATCEALAAGVPALLSAGNDLGPALAAAGCAWHLQGDDEQALADAMIAVAAAPETRLRAMGECGRRWARETLPLERFRTRLAGLLADAVTRAA